MMDRGFERWSSSKVVRFRASGVLIPNAFRENPRSASLKGSAAIAASALMLAQAMPFNASRVNTALIILAVYVAERAAINAATAH